MNYNDNAWAKEKEQFFATLGYDLLHGNEETSVTARGYLTVTYIDGSTQTVYTNAVARSAKQVAMAIDNAFAGEFSDDKGYDAEDRAYALEVLKQIYAEADGLPNE